MLKLWRFSPFAAILSFVLCVLLLQTGVAAASSGWSVVASVNPPGDDTLFAVAATSTQDAWAVGSSGQQNYNPQTLAEHWNGSSWSVIASPNPGPTFNKLLGVTAISSNNAWAVGYYQNNSGSVSTLVEHWNGTVWSVVTSPNPAGSQANQLFAVSAFSASNIWAAGYTQSSNNVTQTLLEHWNGSAWSISTGVNPGASFSQLRGVAAVSATDAWAVGNYTDQQGASKALTERWNGTSWNVVTSGNPGSSFNGLFAITPVRGTDQLWAVGEYANANSTQTLTEQWDGSHWNVITSPTIQTNVNVLSGVTAISANNVWAAGQAGTPSGGINSRLSGSASGGPQGKTLVMHWNGTRWSIASTPNPGTFNNGLNGIARVPGSSQLWTAGAYNNGTPPVQTLIELRS